MFFHVLVFDLQLPIRASHIETGKQSIFTQRIMTSIDAWQRVVRLLSDCIESTVIDAVAKATVLLPY